VSYELLPNDGPSEYSVIFSSHDAAIEAVEAVEASRSSSCHLALVYNQRAYHLRGWCVAEESVAFEVINRAGEYPALQAAMLRPPRSKVYLLTPSDDETGEMTIDAMAQPAYVSAYGGLKRTAATRLEEAFFFAKSDADHVKQLFREYQIRAAKAAITGHGTFEASEELASAKRKAPKGVNPQFLQARAYADVDLEVESAAGMVDEENERRAEAEKRAREKAAIKIQRAERAMKQNV